MSAELDVFAVEPRVTFDDWLRRRTTSPSGYLQLRDAQLTALGIDPKRTPTDVMQERLSIRGTLFYVRTTVEGFKSDDVRVRWSMYDYPTRRRVAVRRLRDVLAAVIAADTPSDRVVLPLWAPASGSNRRRFLRFELLSGSKDLLIAMADSPAFRG